MNTMELIDRYLQATKFWLPRDQKRDIIQELSEDLRSEIEEKENALGHRLSEAEVAALLKQRGHPILIAGRYFPQQHLIGPVLFPIYSLVLKMAALCYLLPWLLVWAGFLIFDRQYRAQHLGFALLGDWANFWQIVIFVFAAITIVFAVLERAQAKSKLLVDWDPRKLPALVQPRKLSFRTRTLVELFFSSSFVVWWLAIGYYPHTFFGFASELLQPAAGLSAYYWPIFGLSLINLAQQVINVVHSDWIWLKPVTSLVTNAIFAVMLNFMLRIEPLVVLKPPYTSIARYIELAGLVNTSTRLALTGTLIGLGIACIISALQIARRVWRGPDAPAAAQLL
jgi:hypothetical protein